jgi:RNA recognition motif-containing protein
MAICYFINVRLMASLQERFMDPFRSLLQNDPEFLSLLKKEIAIAESKTLQDIPSKKKMALPIKTIIIRNLPRTINTEKLMAIFEEYGPICDIYIPKNMNTDCPYYGTIKGFAVIKFTTYSAADAAYHAPPLFIYGNPITVELAKQDK